MRTVVAASSSAAGTISAMKTYFMGSGIAHEVSCLIVENQEVPSLHIEQDDGARRSFKKKPEVAFGLAELVFEMRPLEFGQGPCGERSEHREAVVNIRNGFIIEHGEVPEANPSVVD